MGGAKLSTLIILVPNCPLLLSWCQIVPFIILVPNFPVPNCPVPNCLVPNCPTIKIRYHTIHFKHIHPQNEKQKKRSFILMRTQIGFNLKCIAQCICSKSSGLFFLDNIQNLSSFHTQICSKCNFGFYSITGNYTNEIRLKVCQ